MNHLALIVVAATCLINSGCATILFGTTDKVSIDCNVPTASIKINNRGFTNTDGVYELPADGDYFVEASERGYQKQTLWVFSRVSGPQLLVSILFGGLVGTIIDAVTGGFYVLRPERLMFTLRKKGPRKTSKKGCYKCGNARDEGAKRCRYCRIEFKD